tara:strand:+ start:1266 stop:2567 length:1302 start_codon:yes stop_codon:yes gene_type:complete
MKSLVSFLSEGSLTLGEINKYDWRIKLFMQKYNNGDPFELTDGSSGMIAKNSELEAVIKAGKQPRGFKFSLTTGREIGFNDILKSKEFGGGTSGSGAGAAQTAAAESAQCVYAQCLWDNPKTIWTEAELKAAYTKVEVDTPFDDIMNLSEEWRVSSILGAKILKRGIGRRTYKWYRGTGVQSDMEERFKTLNTAAGRPFNNINKWTPADIWVQATDSAVYDWDSCKTLSSLNQMLLKAYAARDVMGISLKKIVGKAKIVQVNYKKPFKSPVFTNVSFGKRDYWKAKDGYLNFKGGEIQFRTFPTFQAEIIGGKAKHGKVSGGSGNASLMGKMMIEAGANSIEDQKTLVAMFRRDRDKFMAKWYEAYNKSPNKAMKNDEFLKAAEGKDDNWCVSKYLVTTLFNNIKGKEQAFLSLMFRYASSASPDSAVHLKVK